MTPDPSPARARRWHILVFLAPAVLIYSALMIIPLIDTLRLSFFAPKDGAQVFAGIENFVTLLTDPRWSVSFWNALKNNLIFFLIHMAI